jgi:glycosyltransferase involved in cell wall biosynthesis
MLMRHLAYFTDSEAFGGAERYLLQILQRLDRSRWQATLYYHASDGIEPLVQEAGALGVNLHSVPRLPLGLQGARLVPAFARVLRQERPDIFHANLTWPLSSKYGLAAAAMARVPGILATLHSFPPAKFSWSSRLQLRLLAQPADFFITVSRAIGERLQRTFWIPPAKIRVIYNGVPEPPPDPPSPPGVETAGDDRPIVFTAARLETEKGLDYLFQAATSVPNARFVVAGEGPLCDRLKGLASEYDLEDRFFLVGFQAEIDTWLARAGLFVLPSLFEGIPLSILEAMAAGKPVVASQIEGVDEAVLPGETGLLVPPADPQALAQAICNLLSDPARAAAMGQAGKARVKRLFTVDAMVADVLDCYEKALPRREALLERG